MRSWSLPLIFALGSCAKGSPPARPEDLQGPRLVHALPRPVLTLTRGHGAPFDFARETRGKLTFLMFGYTNCPDVCPIHMGNLAAALHALPTEARRAVRVVFVTTDPERDTPEVLASWLAKFDSTFVGVTGAPQSVEEAERALGMPSATRDGELPNGGGYAMSHGAHLWAFTPDDSAHVVYPMGVSKEVIAADVPILLRLWPGR